MRPAMSSSASSHVTRSHSPAPRAPLRRSGIADALGVVHLVERGRALGAVAPAAARMDGIALELLDAAGVLVDVGEEPARRLAVEADGRDEREAPLDLPSATPRRRSSPSRPSARRADRRRARPRARRGRARRGGGARASASCPSDGLTTAGSIARRGPTCPPRSSSPARARTAAGTAPDGPERRSARWAASVPRDDHAPPEARAVVPARDELRPRGPRRGSRADRPARRAAGRAFSTSAATSTRARSSARAEIAQPASASTSEQARRAADQRGDQQVRQEQRRLPEVAALGLPEEVRAVAGGGGGEHGRRQRRGAAATPRAPGRDGAEPEGAERRRRP